MENLDTSHLSVEDSSKPSQPLIIVMKNNTRHNIFQNSQVPEERPTRKRMLQHSYSTSLASLTTISTLNVSGSTKHSQTPAPNMLTLNFSRKELTKFPKMILDYASTLLVLDLSRNQFVEFPDEIFRLSKLKTLKIESNYLKRIPNEIYQLTQLENLSFASNYIVSLPKTIVKLAKTLQSLNLANNHIEVLPKEITELSSLKVLHIQCNFFTVLPIQFDSLLSLKELGLEWYKYTNPPLTVIQNDKTRSSINKLFQLCRTLLSFNKTEVNFEDFINHFSLSNENVFSIRDPLNRNLLHIATIEQEIGIVRYLATYKQHFLNELDQDGQTPLTLAIREENYFLARILLLHGADPKLGGGTFGSGLHMATSKHQVGMIKELLKHGANPNSKDLEGNTALHLLFSVFSKNIELSKEMAQMLIDAGADPNQENNDLWTPLHLAIKRGQTDCIRWAAENNTNNKDNEKKIFDFNAKGGSDEWTPLHLAANLSHYEIMNILLDSGAELMTRTKTGKTARDVATNSLIVMKVLSKMEQRWLKNNFFKPVSSMKKEEGLKDRTALANLENIAPNFISVKQQSDEKQKRHNVLQTKQGSNKVKSISGNIMSRAASSTNFGKGSLKFDMQIKGKKENIEKEEERESKEKKETLNRYGIDAIKDDSLVIGDIDEIIGSKEVTRVMPKSPNNIQKLQIAQNYRNHLLNILSEKEDAVKENRQQNNGIAKCKTTEGGAMTKTYKHPQKIDMFDKELFPNEFSKYIGRFENYTDEIKGYQNMLINSTDLEIPLSEKLKYLFYMKVIHLKLNKRVHRLNSELFPFDLFIICESIDDEIKKNAYNIPRKGAANNNQDIILRTLLFIFENLETKESATNIHIKAVISQSFGEFKYSSARHFLQQTFRNSKEDLLLKKEALCSLKQLQSLGIGQGSRTTFIKEKSPTLSVGSPKLEAHAQPLASIVRASFLSPSGMASSTNMFVKHKRPLSYYAKCENVDEDDEGFGRGKQTLQNVWNKKMMNEVLETENVLNESHEGTYETRNLPKSFFERVHSQSDLSRKMEIKKVQTKLGIANYFSNS